jgi:hypothetical protein
MTRKLYIAPLKIDRWKNTREGMVAFSCSHHCTPQNIPPRIPPPTNNPMTLALAHGYVVPPHCTASNMQVVAPIISTAPA